MSFLSDQKHRFVTNVSTDKPIYKLGDVVYIRSVILSALDQKPFKENRTSSMIEIYGPKGDKIDTLSMVSMEDSVISEKWTVNKSLLGGSYTIKVKHDQGIAEGVRKFEVRAFQNPRLNSQIEFVRKGYGAGDQATFTLNVKRAEGGIPEDAKVTCTARVDGKEIWTEKTTLDKKGNCMCQFQLPKEIKEDGGTLTCVIQDGGVVETATKTIPILLEESFMIDFYPEGGDLICDLECGVYLEANNKNGEPADIIGDILDEKDQLIATISTKHEGRGKTFFIPKADHKYHLKLTKPSGVKKTYPLPEPKKQGVSISSVENTYSADDNISLKLSSTHKGLFIVTLFKRDVQISRTKVSIKKECLPSQFTFTVPSDSKSDGVLRVLVEDEKKNPLAERLIFRKTEPLIKCQIATDYKNYCPGDKAKVKFFTSDQDGNPIKSFICLNVSDESVIQKVEKRKQPPRLPAMVYLEQEVDHLEDANIYLGNDERADLAVDLLLGTQGWRRFAFVDPKSFYEKLKKESKVQRLFGMNENVLNTYQRGPTGPPPPPGPPSMGPPPPPGGSKPPQLSSSFSQQPILNLLNQTMSLKKTSIDEKDGDLNDDWDEKVEVKMEKKVEVKEEKVQVKKEEKKEEVQLTQQVKSDLPPPPPKTFSGPPPPPSSSFGAPPPPGPPPPPGGYSLGPPPCPPPSYYYPVKRDVVREFAFKKRHNRKEGERLDFTETLYWNHILKTDEKGRGEVSFDFSDSISSYRVMADIFTPFGSVASFEKLIECKEPFYMEPIVPLEVTCGDHIKLPLSLVNSSPEELKVKLSGTVTYGLSEPKFPSKPITLTGEERSRTIIDFDVSQYYGECKLTFQGDAGAFSDNVSRNTVVYPLGFPSSIHHSGTVSKDKSTVMKFDIPTIVKGSLTSDLKIFPSGMSNLSAALKSLVREPYGCFEQTSSTSYPLVMAHQYFMKNKVDGKVISDSLSKIERAYQKLISYECKSGGYDWFGSGDGLESLTAYGIMQFSEMSKIIKVDQDMLNRTITWLLKRRDGKGKFNINTGKEYQMSHGSVPAELTLAYVLFALTEAKIIGLEKEVDYLASIISKETNSYVIALASNVLFSAGKVKEAKELNKKLASLMEKDGSISKATTTITRSSGVALSVETTALACLAWFKDYKENHEHIYSAIKYINSKCERGSFGSTQSTILALKAIMLYNEVIPKPKDTKSIININGEKIEIVIPAEASEPIPLVINPDKLNVGKSNQIEVSMIEGVFSFAFSADYYILSPPSSNLCPFDLETKLSSSKFTEGSGGEMNVKIKNLKKENQAMTIAIIGLPGGLEPRHEQLKELVEKKVISFYEIRGREIICYWRAFEESAELKFKIDVVARIPGTYQGPASRAYLYYFNEHKKWVDGAKCEIEPK